MILLEFVLSICCSAQPTLALTSREERTASHVESLLRTRCSGVRVPRGAFPERALVDGRRRARPLAPLR